MFTIRKIIFGTSKYKSPILQRFLVTLCEKELTVTPFCNVIAKLPFNVSVVPLDVHRHSSYDKVIIKLVSTNKNSTTDLQCNNVNDTVDVFSNNGELLEDITCHIEAPIKSNINVTSQSGDIKLSNFNGDNITLTTTSGDISASKCHCAKISLNSSSGNIVCTNVMQAAEIYLKAGKAGAVTTGRLQGLLLAIETESGNIQTESSYCNSSSFLTKNGTLHLYSTHKNCEVNITNKGTLNMMGFDGSLQVYLKEGSADIQVARIQDDSKIWIEENGSLILKLFDTCLQNTRFEMIAKKLHVDSDIKMNATTQDEHTVLSPQSKAVANVLINCKKSNVSIQSTSWMEMFNIKLAK